MEYLIDTHCHINRLQDDELNSLISRASENNVKKMICVGASDGLNSSFESVELCKKYPEIYASVGIHPHDVDNCNWTKELEELISSPKVVAIGETGLDFFKEWSDFKKQEDLFKKTISIAHEVKKPLIIHCRDAFNETYDILKNLKAELTGGVFHCFSGTALEAKKLADINFLVSYTGIITFKNAEKIREEASKIPLTQIMLETDAPYMAPEPFRGKTSEPSHVKYIAETLSKTHNVSLEEIAKITSNNARQLFNGIS